MRVNEVDTLVFNKCQKSFIRCTSKFRTKLALWTFSFPCRPSMLEREIKQDFYAMYGMPNIVAVEGTLIPIIRPCEDEQIFVCRKKNSQFECARHL